MSLLQFVDCFIRVYYFTIQAVFDVDPTEGLMLVEIAEGVTEDEVAKATGCTYKVFSFVS